MRGRVQCANANCAATVADADLDASYSYDSKGRVQNVSNDLVSRKFSYDSYSRLNSESVTIDSRTRSSSFSYDSYQRPATVTYHGGEVVSTSYGSLGVAVGLRSTSYGDLVDNVSYDEAGRMTLFFGRVLQFFAAHTTNYHMQCRWQKTAQKTPCASRPAAPCGARRATTIGACVATAACCRASRWAAARAAERISIAATPTTAATACASRSSGPPRSTTGIATTPVFHLIRPPREKPEDDRRADRPGRLTARRWPPPVPTFWQNAPALPTPFPPAESRFAGCGMV